MGQATGNKTPPEKKNERRSVWAATRKTICPSSYFWNLVKQGASGPAGRLAALNAPLCLGFRRNSEEFRCSTALKRHNKRAEKRPERHHIPPARRDIHCRFCPFPSCCLPAACILCGRLPHMGRGVATLAVSHMTPRLVSSASQWQWPCGVSLSRWSVSCHGMGNCELSEHGQALLL